MMMMMMMMIIIIIINIIDRCIGFLKLELVQAIVRNVFGAKLLHQRKIMVKLINTFYPSGSHTQRGSKLLVQTPKT